MKGKGKLLIILTFLFAVIILGSYSYSKYRSDITGEAKTDVAKWNISVNGCYIAKPSNNSDSTCYLETVNQSTGAVTVVRNFKITEFVINNNGNGNVVDGKIAPGSSGTFNIKIKPNDTEVSFRYTINSHIEDDNLSLSYSIKGPGDTDYRPMPATGYVGRIDYSASNTNYEEVISFKVDWINDENHNKEDTVIGTKSIDPKLEIPVEITFEQYNG